MKVPTYQNQVGPGQVRAAQGELRAPVAGAFGGQVADAAENMGRAVGQAASVSAQLAEQHARAQERQNLRDKNLRKTSTILNWRKDNDELLHGKLNEDGSRVAGGLLTKEYGEAEGITADYEIKARELMDKYLAGATTPEEREEWAVALQQDFQNNYDDVATHQYKQQRARGNLLAGAVVKQQAGLAGAVRTVADMRKNLDETYNVYNENATANSVPTEVQQLARYGIAADNVKASVGSALMDGDIASARTVLEGVKNDLLPADYSSINETIKTAQAAADKAAKEELPSLYQWAFNMAQDNPAALQQEVQLFRSNPSRYQAKISEEMGYNVDAKKLGEFFNWTQTNLLENPATTAGQQKKERFTQDDALYKSFSVTTDKKGKTKIQNKNYDNTESLYTAVQTLSADINNGTLTREDTKTATGYRATLMEQLGQKVMDADYAHNWAWDASCEKMMQNEIGQFAKNAGLSADATAQIYIKARDLAQRANLDLSQDYQGTNADQLENVLSIARKTYYFRNFGVPMDQADAVVYDDKLVKLQEKSKAQRASYVKEVIGTAQQYKSEQIAGQNARVARDKNGQPTSIYFEKGTH